MPQTPHIEKHFTASAVVRDIVIGMSDGLTVPFALAAGAFWGREYDGDYRHSRVRRNSCRFHRHGVRGVPRGQK